MSKHKPVTLQSLLRVLEEKSYFELSKRENNFLTKSIGPSIEAWSFIPHPDVLRQIDSSFQQVSRYIVTIETLRSRIYDAVKTFLLEYKINVNSYYTGGSADFICDAHLNHEDFSDFYSKLINVLRDAGAKDIQDEPKTLVTVFKVRNPVILCRKNLSIIEKPDADIVETIRSNPHSFELLLRNYRSQEAVKEFGGEEKVLKFLKRLKSQNVILGYRVIFDFSHSIDRQYVPLCLTTYSVPTILKKPKKNLILFLEPVVELLEVLPTEVTDQADMEVSHICINEYDAPMKRREWRKEFYSLAGDSVNMFSYPLEGTLNESPIYISNLPETIKRGRLYQESGAEIGELYHPLLKSNPDKIKLSLDGLLYHGMTLGDSNIGKTTTDIVLSTSLIGKLPSIIVLDNSKSIREKRKLLPANISNNDDVFIQIDESDTIEIVKGKFQKAITLGGFRVIECPQPCYSLLLESVIQEIQNGNDGSKDGAPRKISRFLLIEESNDAFGADSKRKERIDLFIQMLTKASRKGWCVWLSTQKPSFLGYDEKSSIEVMNLLQNKIIHSLVSEPDRKTLLLSLVTSNQFDPRQDKKLIEGIPSYHTFVQGVKNSKNQSVPLPPIQVHIIEPNHNEGI